jgi:glutamate-ammonia-ligase adenylyltransferase
VFAQLPHLAPRCRDRAAADRNWRDWVEAADRQPPALAAIMKGARDDSRLSPWLDCLFGCSPYLSGLALAHPRLIATIATQGHDAALAEALTEVQDRAARDPNDTMGPLRRAKAGVALVVATADVTGAWPLMRITGALSDFADRAVTVALAAALRQGHDSGNLKLLDPDDPARQCGYVVLALGKHGGRELNYSSDIDLYVMFDEQRFPYAGSKSAQEFAVRVTRYVVRVMQERTADGYVFRTDLRLRPDPSSTAIAVSRQAATTYYESYGQNWERAALIKARFIAGDADLAASFLKDLETFIWRKSLDFYAIEDIRSIERQIYAHKGGATVAVPGHNIKLGRGGIREIEFYAQTQQLIWGGRLLDARSPQTFGALDALQRHGIIAAEARDQLSVCYSFLRQLEHRLQMIADAQTQTLPHDAGELAHLAVFMGFADVESFSTAVTDALTTVEGHYARLFEESPSLAVEGNLVFTGAEDDPDTLATLRALGFANPSAVAASVRVWHTGRYKATRTLRARQILTELIPILLKSFGTTLDSDAAFARFDNCLAQINTGVQLLSVLQANPKLLALVAEIMGDAPRLADRLTANPALLDAVLDPEFFAPLKPLADLKHELEQACRRAPDFETFLETVRRWANEQRFKAGLHILRGLADTVAGAEQLSDIAETVLVTVVPRVHEEFARQHGRVPDSDLAIIGYGKLGSRELTPASDLDIVLVYSGDESTNAVGAERHLPASAYYIRLAQRIVTALTALSGQGRLYDVDLRLRPSGDKGPLACSTTAFAKYMREDAWTWEHMALTRARVVVGTESLRSQIDAVIAETLGRPRDPDALVCAIADMRQRMRRDREAESHWDLKRRRGGLVDIEFIAQYLRLRYPDTVAIASGGIAGLLTTAGHAGHIGADDAETLIRSLHLLTGIQVLIRLTLEDDKAHAPFPQGLCRRMAAKAGVATFADLESLLAMDAAAVNAIYDRVIDRPGAAARKTFGDDIPH